MNQKISEVICCMAAQALMEEYMRSGRIPEVDTSLMVFLDHNSLTVSSDEIFVELVFRASQTFQNLILEHRSRL
ncbi:hypothetical protein [Anthocerotibacter panamensis]|uniref:hypothetical protein n=1 Tax=Anthocerotibacter panamensis TaxID=2857077 RepID=UPI001C403521|nr:hypothetical protein [Anthocerotibacter panamensis]